MSAATALLLVALLLTVNAVWVAAEFALAALRRPVLEESVARGGRRAGLVASEIGDLADAVAASRVGITVASLLLGVVADRALGTALFGPTVERLELSSEATVLATTGVAVLVVTSAAMVLAELFPKNLAISRPLAVATAVVPFTRAVRRVLGPVLTGIDRTARWVTSRVLRVELGDPFRAGHSLDELARIVSASGEEGSLSGAQTRLLKRAIELGEVRAGQVMIPRPDVVWLTAGDTLADLRDLAHRTGFSRFPVHGATEDEVLGTVHVKDLLGRDHRAQAATSIAEVVQAPLVVPESQSLRRLLTDLRREHRTFAVVVDEFGGTAGVVTVEDVLEVLVGDIRDEFDPGGSASVTRVASGHHVVAGTVRVDELTVLLGEELPEGPFETVAGFVLDRLGRIAVAGDRCTVATSVGPVELEVTAVDGVRITEVTVTVPEPEPEVEPGAAPDRGDRP